MLITELKVSGYKTLRDVRWHPGQLNVVIGPNASGKSNLLRLLRLLNEAANGRLYDHVINDGGFGALTWNGEGKRIDLQIVLGQQNPPLSYTLQLVQVGDTASFAIVNESLALARLNGITLIDSSPEKSFVMGDHDDWTEWPRKSLTESLLFQANIKVSPAISSLAVSIGDWSVNDDFHSEKGASIRRPVISRYDQRLVGDGQNLASVLHTYYENDSEFQDNIDQAMTAAFGDEYRSLAFPPAGSQNIELCVRWKSIKRPQPASTLSDGTLRFLFLITALSLPKPPSLIAIDEPEAGLHPTMMRIVAEYAENAALTSQVIFTTHSTAFLNGFSKDEPPTVTVMELVDGESRMRVLDPATLGRWLKDYSLGQLYQSHELEQMPGLEEAA